MHFPRDVVPDPNAPNVRVVEQGAPSTNPSDWLGDALGQMTSQIQRRLHEVENRHSEAMRDMQAKLERMSRDAERARPTLPPDLAAAFGRIEEGMTDLVTRIAHAKSDPGAAADRFVFAPKSDDTISFVLDPRPAMTVPETRTPVLRPRGPVPEGGWDSDAAEALMQLYESGDTGLSLEAMALAAPTEYANGAAPLMGRPRAPTPVVIAGLGDDRGWLEERFGALTDKFSQSLANAKPDAALDRLMNRIDSLETRFDKAIANVANGISKGADAASIRQIETQISELGRQMGSVTQQLGRLGAIEQNLADLTAFAAASHDVGEPQSIATTPAPFDMTALADIVANKAADRLSHLASTIPNAGQQAVSNQSVAAQAMLQEFMRERRKSDEQTNGMLDTMQEALVRLIDRVEAIDAAATETRALHTPEPTRHGTPPTAEPKAQPEPQRNIQPERPSELEAEIQQKSPPTPRATQRVRRPARAMTEPIVPQPELDRNVEIIDASTLTATVEDVAAQSSAPSGNLRNRVRASVGANVAEPVVSEAAPKVAKRSAPRAKPGAPTVGKRGVIIVALVLGLVVVSYIASLLLAERYGGLIPGGNKTPALPKAATIDPRPMLRDSVDTKQPLLIPPVPSSAPQQQAPQPPQRSGAIDQPQPRIAPQGTAQRQNSSPIQEAPQPATSMPPQSVPETVTDDLSMLDPNDSDPVTQPQASSARLASNTAPAISASPIAGIALDRSQPALQPHEMAIVAAGSNRETARPLASARMAAPQQLGATPQAQLPPQQQPQVLIKNAASIVTGTTNRATVTSFGAQPPTPKAPANTALTEATQEQAELPPAGVGPMSLRISAAQGDPSAAFEVGSRLAEGRGVRQDFALAYTWYQRSAAKGLALAQYRLGTLYERGLGTSADLARARVWYKRAAEQGNVKAMHNLAVLVSGRDGTPPDHIEAAKWFTLAADRGLADSQFNLGVLTDNGLGVTKDQRAAYKWFSLAARGGDKEAARRRDTLVAVLDVAILGALDGEIAQWRPRAVDRMANEPRVAGDAWRNRRPAEPQQQDAQPQQGPQPPSQAMAGQPPPQAPAAPAAVRRFAPPPQAR